MEKVPTPSFRRVGVRATLRGKRKRLDFSGVAANTDESDSEDTSDSAYAERHRPFEENEKLLYSDIVIRGCARSPRAPRCCMGGPGRSLGEPSR